MFKRFETLVAYLKDLGIAEYRVDAARYDPKAAKAHKPRPDSAARLKRAHAAAYAAWLKAKVAASLAGIDDGSKRADRAKSRRWQDGASRIR